MMDAGIEMQFPCVLWWISVSVGVVEEMMN